MTAIQPEILPLEWNLNAELLHPFTEWVGGKFPRPPTVDVVASLRQNVAALLQRFAPTKLDNFVLFHQKKAQTFSISLD